MGKYQNIKDEDVLVFKMDMCDFDKHQECVDKVMEHFGKVKLNFAKIIDIY